MRVVFLIALLRLAADAALLLAEAPGRRGGEPKMMVKRPFKGGRLDEFLEAGEAEARYGPSAKWTSATPSKSGSLESVDGLFTRLERADSAIEARSRPQHPCARPVPTPAAVATRAGPNRYAAVAEDAWRIKVTTAASSAGQERSLRLYALQKTQWLSDHALVSALGTALVWSCFSAEEAPRGVARRQSCRVLKAKAPREQKSSRLGGTPCRESAPRTLDAGE